MVQVVLGTGALIPSSISFMRVNLAPRPDTFPVLACQFLGLTSSLVLNCASFRQW